MTITADIAALRSARQGNSDKIRKALADALLVHKAGILEEYNSIYTKRAEWALAFDFDNVDYSNPFSASAVTQARMALGNLCVFDRESNTYSLSAEEVATMAETRWELTSAEFIARLTSKILAAVCGHEQFEITVSISQATNALEGTTRVTTSHGHFTLHTSLKHNTSKNGNPFLQYPTRVTSCSLRVNNTETAKDFARSLGELVEAFSLADDEEIQRLLAEDEAEAAAAKGLEFTYQNLKALSNLHRLLANYDKLCEEADKRRARRACSGTQRPDGQIKRLCATLDLDREGLTADKVVAIAAATLTDEAKALVAKVNEQANKNEWGRSTWIAPTGRKWDGYAEYAVLKKAEWMNTSHRVYTFLFRVAEVLG